MGGVKGLAKHLRGDRMSVGLCVQSAVCVTMQCKNYSFRVMLPCSAIYYGHWISDIDGSTYVCHPLSMPEEDYQTVIANYRLCPRSIYAVHTLNILV